MKWKLCTLVLLVIIVSTAGAQDHRITRYEREPNYLAFRLGTWFPKDKEKSFTLDDVSYDNAVSQIDQSQAIGLELEYQNLIAHPLYLDFSLGGWYSTYTFKYTEVLEDPASVQNADSWAVVMPVTLGLSFHPLSRSAIQPYVMAGAGASFGFSGRTMDYFADQTESKDDNKNEVAFSWFFGAGFDFLFTPGLGASLGVKYNNVVFDNALLTQQKDFTGLTISLGITVAQAYID